MDDRGRRKCQEIVFKRRYTYVKQDAVGAEARRGLCQEGAGLQ